MSLLNDLFKGAIALSILALAGHAFTVKGMAKEAAKLQYIQILMLLNL